MQNMSSLKMIVNILPILGVLWSFIYILHSILFRPKNGRLLPPGPRSLPIIGNLHMFGNAPHRNLGQLAKKYGHIMSMRLGNVPAIVVSTPQAAELFLKTYDAVFASRPKVQSTEYLSYGTKSVVFSQYGPYWRNARKLCAMELLTPAKIDLFAPMRKVEMGLIIKSLKEAATALEVVDASAKVAEVIEEMTYQMLFGRSKDKRFELKAIIHDAMNLSGIFNIGDYVPYVGAFDLQGLTRRLKDISSSLDKIMDKIIDEHIEETSRGHEAGHHGDFIHMMLVLMKESTNSHEEPVYMIDRTSIKAITFDMTAGAIDTSFTAIEWAFSELIRNPRVMKKVQEELENVVSLNRMVEETDLPNLIYLDMVVKESFRLHPVAPFLIPHESIEDITINGYFVPKKSRIMINTWAIQRDVDVWGNNAEEFYPERFSDNGIDLMGRDFELLPFGSGRRGCPGMRLGLTTVRLIIAQFVHCFNWELPNGMLHTELDMTEKFGLAMPRVNHLLAIPTYRLLL